jgi:hypothetical protein
VKWSRGLWSSAAAPNTVDAQALRPVISLDFERLGKPQRYVAWLCFPKLRTR